jgi:uncharacterized membrane protein YeaQ/YmgE (transglycosylase-associated protein family)
VWGKPLLRLFIESFNMRKRYFLIGVDLSHKEGEMSLLGLLILLVIAAVAGTIGQALAGYSMGGCLASILIGFVGAFLGMWLANNLGLPELFTINVDGQPFPVVWSIIGSTILALIFGLLTRRRVY